MRRTLTPSATPTSTGCRARCSPGGCCCRPPGHGGDLDAVYACQYTHSAGTSGVLDTGLLAEPERTTVTCFPVVVHHGS
ncbi:hypothetical protein [Actinomadura madurae]|uniref:hypothetical protein n=1 Tax=Actinomadura madurae TaxID=1993 RepID=UPI0020D237D3|nr:hypothetical protein [Actinomadura madurae]MCP9970824.1 hypothetical protein [Actinomadura madurae]MCP9983305.1 hypothetical protein [Actinomadura madurae]MCQ0005134.1 hypothetical protein [Actinomadura madurae]MCQ0019553.1 hypothetical protein [Actinomadura madurae]